MKKILVFIVTISLAIGLTACDGTGLTTDEDMYTEAELRTLINEVIAEQEDDGLTETEITAIINTYLDENVVGATLSETELTTLITTLIADNSVSTTYTEEQLTTLVETLLEEANVTANYDIVAFQQDVTDMLDAVKTGVVGLVTSSDEGSASGSGVIYKNVGDEYYMITNEHVVQHYSSTTGLAIASTIDSIVYERNGMLFEIPTEDVELLGADATTDIAVVRFTSDQDFAVIDFADSYEIEVGDFVFAIGNPLGFEYYGTVTMGVISGIARYVSDDTFDATLLQHDAAISPGNSGGALINVNGELIGINNMKIVDADVTGIGFAIPSNTVKRVAEDLEDDGIVTRPYLGVQSFTLLPPEGMDYGVSVSVVDGGAASAAGLIDDDVIVGWKNITTGMTEFFPVYNFNDLREAILNSSVGDTIQLEYYRMDTNGDYVLQTSTETVLNVHPDDQ